MLEGIDFKILEFTILPDTVKRVGGGAVYQARVHSNHSQSIFAFDDRSGSWLTTKTDDRGRRKEPHPALAAALSVGLSKVKDKLVAPPPPLPPAPLPDNPFMAAVADNPFMR